MRKQTVNKGVIVFFFSNTIVGGAEVNVLKIATELKNNNYTIHLLVFEDNGPLMKNVPKFYDSFEIIGRFEKSPFKSILKFIKFLNKTTPTYISCFGLRVDLFVRCIKLFTFRKYCIIGNIRGNENWRNKIHIILDRVTSFLVFKWVSNSVAGMKVFIKREKIPPNKIEVIYNFIDYDRNNRIILRSEIDIFKIGVLANYKKSKGHFNLIEISKIFNNLNFEHKFICAGYDYTNGLFNKHILKNKMEKNFELKGFIDDKNKFFNEIDIMLLPSYMEGLPTSIIEGMAYGIPVIASNVDGLPEVIIDDYNGLLAEPDDISLFVSNLIKLKNYNLRIKYTDNGYLILDKLFNKEINMLKWKKLFNPKF
jgi:glycosyltransferase involved in cell wall biosynthesis